MAQYGDEVLLNGYRVIYTSLNGEDRLQIRANDTTLEAYPTIPTEEEANTAIELSDIPLYFSKLFYSCSNLEVSPKLVSAENYFNAFFYCKKLLTAPVIPEEATYTRQMFYQCTGLLQPPSIPQNVTNVEDMFYNCTSVGGEMVIRPTSISSSNYADMFYDTVEDITLYGDQTLCTALAGTATNGNVAWSNWYDPITPVTNRGEGSRTTATDIERMVKNGVLAVSTYAPARMNFTDNDIVHEDEWIALCDAAKTIDNTITYSTHYANLNKIESAFDSVL